jgi:phage gp29-like protein
MCVGLERWAIPTPKVKVDRSQAEQQGLTDSDLSAMIDDAADQAQAFLATEQSFLVESPVIQFDSYGMTPNLYSQGPLDIIKECDNQISQAFLAQFANLGISDTGSRSVGEVHLSVFRRAAINLCDIVASQISGADRRGGGTIGRLIRWNYGYIDPSKLPRLTHTGLDTDDLAESLGMLPGLVQSGLLTPDDELERAIRERLGAGDLPEVAERSPLDRTAKQGGGVAALAETLMKRKKANG